MDYKYILFDLDGTLTDPKVGITKSMQYALKRYDIIEEDLNRLEGIIGPPLGDSFKDMYQFSEDEIPKAIEIFREYFSEKGIYENTIYTGIKELLEWLKSEGKIIAVATSKPTNFAVKVLKHFDIDRYFDCIIGSNMDGSRAEKVDIINMVIKTLDIDKLDEVIMVGDRKYDIIGANAVGIDSIGVLYGYGSASEFELCKPKYMVEDVNGIRDVLTPYFTR